VEKACLREAFSPLAGKNLPARDADVHPVLRWRWRTRRTFLAVYCMRYGNRRKATIFQSTEMESQSRARGKIPTLVFLIHKEHPLIIDMVETEKEAKKATRGTERALQQRTRTPGIKSPGRFARPKYPRPSRYPRSASRKGSDGESPPEFTANLITNRPNPTSLSYCARPSTWWAPGRLDILTEWGHRTSRCPTERASST